MDETFREIIDTAHALGLKIGPVYERERDVWRAYVQKGNVIFRFGEADTLTGALVSAVEGATRQLKPAPPRKAPSFLD